MVFNSVPYMIFLPIAGLLYYIVPAKFQKIYLLLVSYYFYACFDIRALPFLIGATLISYLAGVKIDSCEDQKTRKRFLILALAVNLGMLIVFKYANFFT